MLTPSYSQLMDVIKQNEKLDNRVTSRYTVVLAAAKRARQLTDGANPLTYAPTDRAVSIAVKEMSEGKLRLRVHEELLHEDIERVMRDRQSYRTALSKDDLNENLKQDYAPTAYSTDGDDSAGEHELFPAFEKEEPAVAVEKEEEDFTLYEESDEEAKGESEGE
jgi:DNA-directed RNA polymerase subunit omega